MSYRSIIKTAQTLLSRPDRADGSMSDKLRLAQSSLPKLSVVQIGRVIAHALYTNIGIVEATAKDSFLLSPKQASHAPALSIPESSESALEAVFDELPAGLAKPVREYLAADFKSREKGIFPIIAAILNELPEWTEYQRLVTLELAWRADKEAIEAMGFSIVMKTASGFAASFPPGSVAMANLNNSSDYMKAGPAFVAETDGDGVPIMMKVRISKKTEMAEPAADTTDH